jgi:cysteinyl-tRNA synthetase
MAESTSAPAPAASTLLSNLTVAEDTALPSVSAPAPAPPLQLFNSMTKKKELFVPREEGKVGMYVCGVTPYDLSHVGHARAYVAFDVLYR